MLIIDSVMIMSADYSAQNELNRFLKALDAFPESPGMHRLIEYAQTNNGDALENLMTDIFKHRFNGHTFMGSFGEFLSQFDISAQTDEKNIRNAIIETILQYAGEIEKILRGG